MRRILSIAICSAALAVPASGQWPSGSAEYSVQTSHYRGISTDPASGVALGTQYSAGTRRFSHGSYTVQPYLIVMSNYNVPNPRWVIPITGNTNHVYDLTANEWTIYGDTNRTNVISSGYRENYVPLATNAFSWTFGPEWAGAVVTVQATNGQTIGSWGLPAQIGPGGYVLSSSIVTNASLLNGAGVYLDGQSVSSLATAASLAALTNAFRPGYDIEFDGTYTGGEWQIRRSDGSIAMSGGIATLGDAAAGRFTLTGTNTGTLWTRVPAGDGMGSAWVPTVVTFQGNNNVVSYSLVNNPAAPTPTPFPTPAPLTSPTPVPTPPAASTNSPVTVSTNVPAPTNDVIVNVDPLTLEDADDGEQQVLDGVGDLSQLVVGIVSDMRTAQTNIIASGAAFSELRLGGVGKNCTFQFGPASITLQTSEPVRAGLKLLILGIGAFAAAAMIRGAVQS